ncbi:13364_t:CDS:1, partial [Acaulospora colombiana]
DQISIKPFFYPSQSVLNDIASDAWKNTDAALLFHAEVEISEEAQGDKDPHDYDTFLQSRPQRMEVEAIQLVTRLQRSHPSVRCHIVHLTAADALPIIRDAKAAGLKLTVETCFHYLTFISSDVPSGHPEFKCCPPIRDESNREELWQALADGTIDFVVSDHSPCVASLKMVDDGNFMKAWGGVSGLGLGLSALWTGAKQRGHSISKVIEWTSHNTAVHARLADRKGRIEKGLDADLIIWDPNGKTE